MGKGSQLNTLLVEILIAVLFFAMAATVVLDAFVIARSQSREAAAYNVALAQAQDVADSLYVSDDAQTVLESAGFKLGVGEWTRADEDFMLAVSLSEEAMRAGVMRVADVRVERDGATLFTLPCSRYLPEGGTL